MSLVRRETIGLSVCKCAVPFTVKASIGYICWGPVRAV